MTDVDIRAARAIELLDKNGCGEVIPAQAELWESVSRPWNTAVAQRPAVVVIPRTVADLRGVLQVAAQTGLGVTTQPSGHGANTDLAGLILIRPTAFNEVDIDTDKRIATIGAGVLWGQVTAALNGTGLVAAFGSNPSTSVVGYLLAGGLSLFSRAQGLGVESLRRVELLFADGTHRWVDDSDGDLMWALRGAGGALGVVTRVEIDLHPVGAINGGKLLFPLEEAADVLEAALTNGGNADDALSLTVGLTTYPDIAAVAPILRGQKLASLDAFGFDNYYEHSKVLDDIRCDILPLIDGGYGPLEVGDIHGVIHEPTKPLAMADWSRLTDVTRPTVDGLVELFAEGGTQGWWPQSIQIRVLGGALARPAAREGIAGQIADPHLLWVTGAARPGPQRLADVSERLENLLADDAPARTIATFLGRGQTYRDAYDDPAIERLLAVKESVDPAGIVHGNRDPQRTEVAS